MNPGFLADDQDVWPIADCDNVAVHFTVDAQAVAEPTSPRSTVPSPMRLRIGGCFLKNAHMAGFLSEFHSLAGTYAALAVEYPDLHGFYHGPRRVV